MSDTTKIEWTATHLPDGTVLPGYTFNPWTGCTKVSPGCDHCYAEGWSKRSGHVEWGPHGSRRRTSAANWAKPIKWNAEAEASGIRRKVFCASLADVFDNHGSITSGWHGDLWHLIACTPHLDWLMLTKRPQNIAKMLPETYGAPAWGSGWPNVWLGTTCENQDEADRRIPHLLAVPAAVRFLSCEPLLGEIDLDSAWHGETALNAECWGECGWCDDGHPPLYNCHKGRQSGCEHAKGRSGIDWVITGGESGPGARPMHPDWARSLRDQCTDAGVPFFFKQWGEWADMGSDVDVRRGDEMRIDLGVIRTGKKRAGRQLDGREWNQMPGVA